MDYTSENHSKHLLIVHLIFSCKYRKRLLVKYGEEIKDIFYDISEENGLNIIEMEVDKIITIFISQNSFGKREHSGQMVILLVV